MLAYFIRADLGPKANPANIHYIARPNWHFRFVFQWVKYWPGRRAVIGIVVVPGIITLRFLIVAFIDRGVSGVRGRGRRQWKSFLRF